jgi:hypothetical protein
VQLDLDLQTASWRTPWTEARTRVKPRDPDAPPEWWAGDAEATESFLHAVGARLNPDGSVAR